MLLYIVYILTLLMRKGMGSNYFTLYVLPFNGADIVLGVEWLKGLGPNITYYTTLNMHFTHIGLPVQLQVDVAYGPASISTHQVRRSLYTHCTSALFHLSIIPISEPDPSPETTHPIQAIQTILTKISSIFNQPHQLPLLC